MNYNLEFIRTVFTKANHLIDELTELRDGAIFAMGAYAGDRNAATEEPAQTTYTEISPGEPPAPLNKKSPVEAEQGKESEFLGFTDKEISKMSKQFRIIFKANGFIAHVRKRKCSKYAWSYEIRYRRNGYNIVASAPNLTDAKARFIEKLKNAEQILPKVSKVPQTFQEFAIFYFTNYRKKKVAEQTYRSDISRFKNHIAPHFQSTPIKQIIPSDCNSLLDSLLAKNKNKTAEEVYGLLNTIFKGAIAHHIISINPMDIIPAIDHEREHGTALTKKEEKNLLESFAGTKYERLFAIALYTGLRPNEYSTARIDGAFIIAKNSKRKGKRKKEVIKKIPITPMLRPYLEGAETIDFASYDQMNNRLKKILPFHKLYDLRTTFYTRCKECGI